MTLLHFTGPKNLQHPRSSKAPGALIRHNVVKMILDMMGLGQHGLGVASWIRKRAGNPDR